MLHNNFKLEFFISNFYMPGIQILNLRFKGNPTLQTIVCSTSKLTLVACLLPLFALPTPAWHIVKTA